MIHLGGSCCLSASTSLRPLFDLIDVGHNICEPGLFFFFLVAPDQSHAGDHRRSQVHEESCCVHALLYDPDGTSTSGKHNVLVLPSATRTASAPVMYVNFEAQSHGLNTRCLRFVVPVA